MFVDGLKDQAGQGFAAITAILGVMGAENRITSYNVCYTKLLLAADLVADLALSPADLGLLTSAYFLSFAAFQPPLGILLDRFGSRRVESLLLLFAAAGALLFSVADSMAGLLLSYNFV